MFILTIGVLSGYLETLENRSVILSYSPSLSLAVWGSPRSSLQTEHDSAGQTTPCLPVSGNAALLNSIKAFLFVKGGVSCAPEDDARYPLDRPFFFRWPVLGSFLRTGFLLAIV